MAEVASVTAPHIAQNSAVTLTATFDADPGATTVAVTNLAGETVKASAAAGTTATATERTVALTGTHTADLDTLTATWVTTNIGTLTTRHEVVGRFLFSVAEARAFRPNEGSGATPLASTDRFPTATIEAARAAVLDELETITGQAFIPRYRVATMNGTGIVALVLDTFNLSTVRSVETRTHGTQDWVAYDSGSLADLYVTSWGELRRESLGTFTEGYRNVRVGYEYGHTSPPRDVVKAALMMLVDNLVASNISDRAISISGEVSTEQLFTANISARGAALYSSPEVHRILSNHLMRRIVVA